MGGFKLVTSATLLPSGGGSDTLHHGEPVAIYQLRDPTDEQHLKMFQNDPRVPSRQN